MSKQKSQGQGQGDDLFSNIILGMAALFIFAYIIWSNSHVKITTIVLWLRYMELTPFTYFSSDAKVLREWIGGLNTDAVSISLLGEISSESGKFTRWLVAPQLLAFGVLIFIYSPLERFKKKHTMQSLAAQETLVWPEISPIAKKNLVKGNITEGVWAVSMTENEFASKHKLLNIDGTLDKAKTTLIFSAQLGSIWTGHETLPAHRRAIFAALATRIAGKPDEAIIQLRKLAKSYSLGTPDYSWVDEAIKNYSNHKVVLEIQKKHAYTLTVLATMLQISRADGVLASAIVVWLREVDRNLWYVLNGVGRYAFFVESSGVMAHWLFEKELGQKTFSPCVNSAVEGLEMALAEYCEDDAEERLYK